MPKSVSEFGLFSLEKIFRSIPEDSQITVSKDMNIWWALDTNANCVPSGLKDLSQISL